MPELFIPLFLFGGAAIVLGIMSIPPSPGHLPYTDRERTSDEKALAVASALCWIAAFGFGGGLLASYIPPASF